jgi:hypothetical protein
LVLAFGRNDWSWFPALPLNSLFSSCHRLNTSLPAAYSVLPMLSFLGFFPNEAAKGSRLSTLLYNHTVKLQLLQNVGMPCPHFVLTPSICCTSLRLTARRALVLGFLALLILCNCVSIYLRKLIDVSRFCTFPPCSSDSGAFTVTTNNHNADSISQMTLACGCGVRTGLLVNCISFY